MFRRLYANLYASLHALQPLPIGVQIIAAPWREDIALRIAHHLETAQVAKAPRPLL